MATLQHASLNTTLTGKVLADSQVWQFRGLQYASIASRFAKPSPIFVSGTSRKDLDCTSFGPRCPQNYVDFRHLLRIPESYEPREVQENEFLCLNLDITGPSFDGHSAVKPSLPVLIWIHGGSQIVTFGSCASGLCDPGNLVLESLRHKLPIIVVTINYRLNMFAFGDRSGEKNLALRDQEAAFHFVRQHISGFGGDPQNITVAGESAGAVYSHAHLVLGAPVQQFILQSGSLHLNSPQPPEVAQTVIEKVECTLAKRGGWTLRNAPVQELLKAQASLGMTSSFLQMEPGLETWQTSTGNTRRLLVGDCEFESIFLRNGIESLSVDEICQCFDKTGNDSKYLRQLYGIIPSRPSSCRIGALDFLHDARFTAPTELMVSQWRSAHKPVFRYLMDEPNPWQASNRAHHAIDLVYLFNTLPLDMHSSAATVSLQMSQKWIEFIAGKSPWNQDEYFAFGPFGENGVVSKQTFSSRRRKVHCDALARCSHDSIIELWRSLAAGKISLEN